VNRGQEEYYKRDYQVAKDAGKPFFPYAVYKDLLIASLAIGLVIVLAIWQRVDVGEPVNPASTDFVPRPEWYFFFLFELLRIFKGQNVVTPVIMATFIIPNIMMVLLILLPFYDRGPERRIQRRPIALLTAAATIFFLGYLTQLGAEAPEGVGAGESLPLSGLDEDPEAQAGAELFVANGCVSCHMVAGVGAPGPGPNLSDEGSKGNPPEFYEGFLKDPPGAVMPAFTGFTPEQYQQIGTLLSGLGTKYN
jgi:ubiquinol-cytochrome c reductase cytochrome b subunit/menaquinol-cytochrome c reductase cytochrome b/c subunit